MTRIQKTVLWTVAVCVFGYMSAHILIIEAPGTAAAQDTPGTEAAPENAPQATDKAPVPEEPAATDPVAPARVLTLQDRALTAICVGDKGEPLDDVIVDIFRQTFGESPLSPPRVETFGRTKTQDGGRFSVALPLIKSEDKSDEGLSMYVVYFTAPGRQIKSLIVANDTKLPTKIAIPTTSTERLYLPTHHLVLAKTKGISVSPMLSAPRFVTKDGQLARVEQFADHRNSDEQAAQERIQAARQKLTDAKTDEEKKAARAQLKQLLADAFTQDMQAREKQAAEIESRLAKLRQQYAEREKVKDEIIDLQLQVEEADAAGLGFPGGDSSRATPPSSNRDPPTTCSATANRLVRQLRTTR